MYALVDGNNFYFSCEKVFRPSLNGRPVVVLSNNDGCCIARSNEAKALGIKMGEPWFKVRHLEESAGLIGLSANFVLYGDMSDRMMSLAAGLGPTQEVYSIDESFIGLHGVSGDLTRRAHAIRSRILRWIGIPCGIGIAPTKTLAKLANHVAKTAERKPGSYPADLAQVCNLTMLPASELDSIMAATEVRDIWGVGGRIGAQLQEDGVMTVLDFVRLTPATVRNRWGVTLERTLRELQGQSCIEFEDAPAPKRQIACTRSFGRPVSQLEPMIEAVSAFASRAAEKLRKQGSLAGQILVFAHTSPFRPGPRFSRSLVVPLRRPTADTRILVQAAVAGMHAIFEQGFDLMKAGVMLLDITSGAIEQGELALGDDVRADRTRLMVALDSLNGRFGKGSVHIASTGVGTTGQQWNMRQERKTPAYTTSWDQIAIARA
jgi:DNA polymerase V